MPYIFCVDATNFDLCAASRLAGVPDNVRAYSQILNVSRGDAILFHVGGTQTIHGVFSARSNVFREKYPQSGPWNCRDKDRRLDFYPFRVKLSAERWFRDGVPLAEIARLLPHINAQFFDRKTVAYLGEGEFRTIEHRLSRGVLRFEGLREEAYPSIQEKAAPPPLDNEEALYLVIQRNLMRRESGLCVLDTFVNIADGAGKKRQLDLLARDADGRYVVIEVKFGDLEPDIWNQTFTYLELVARRFRVKPASVRALVFCENVGPEAADAWRYARAALGGRIDIVEFSPGDRPAKKRKGYWKGTQNSE